jgi:hypothetical protein
MGTNGVVAQLSQPFPQIVESLRKGAAALREAEIDFVLGGSLACWARGGPEVSNDLDLLVRREDADAALDAMAAAGMRTERPPEGWLYKAWDGDVLIDLIFRLVDRPVDDELIQRADELNVASVSMRVMSLEDFLAIRLLALDEHNLDLSAPVLIARALREKIDWADLRRQVGDSPYASAYLHLLERLGVLGPEEGAGSSGVSVRAANGPPQRAPTFGPRPGEPR